MGWVWRMGVPVPLERRSCACMQTRSYHLTILVAALGVFATSLGLTVVTLQDLVSLSVHVHTHSHAHTHTHTHTPPSV